MQGSAASWDTIASAPGGRLTDLHAKRPKVALAGTTGALHITWTKADMASTLAAHAVRVLGAR